MTFVRFTSCCTSSYKVNLTKELICFFQVDKIIKFKIILEDVNYMFEIVFFCYKCLTSIAERLTSNVEKPRLAVKKSPHG